MTTPQSHGSHWLQQRFGLSLPILQAPMAGVQDHHLAVSVAQAGGLGAIAAATFTPDALRAEVQAFRQQVTAPLNINFFCHTPPTVNDDALHRWHSHLRPHYQDLGLDADTMPQGAGRTPFGHDMADAIEAFRPEVVSFHFGLPEPGLLDRVKRWGSLVLSSATTVDEALWLADLGADAIIAQGLEAGGHRGHFLSSNLSLQAGLFSLLPHIVKAVHVPVIAAGGIATAAHVQAAQALGAQAVQVGTALLLSPEATTSPLHRQALAQAHTRPTALTRLFTGRPARGLVNRFMTDMEPQGQLSAIAPEFPLATAALAPLRNAAERLHRDDYTPLWAGQSAALTQAQPAAHTLHQLSAGWQP